MQSFLSISGRRLVLLVALCALWFLLSGYFGKATLVAFGAFSVAVTLWFSERAGVIDREGVPTTLFPGLLSYMAWLFLEIGKANVMVAREVLRRDIRLAPKLFRVPANQPSDLTRTIFGNSVTLTPGTVTVDVRRDSLLIHALDEAFADVDAICDIGERVTRLETGRGR